MMFELTNEQRKCFALLPVNEKWERIEAKQSSHDTDKTYLYLDGDTIVKCVIIGDSRYSEYELCENVSSDRKYILPKTNKGKPTLLSSSSVQKRSAVGMRLSFYNKYINLYNSKTECSYYFNSYLNDNICDMDSFSKWVNDWCNETTDADIEDINEFSKRERRHIRFKDGDVFRFKIGRRLYGYGRVILDYDKMRRQKEPFWDILMIKPVVCSVYHIVSKSKNVSVDELKQLSSLPSTIISDNSLYYGEFEIIGNIPIGETEDYPIMYGNSIDMRERAICYQCGKTYIKIENATTIYQGFINNGVSFDLNIKLDILLKCIDEKSNDTYWSNYYKHYVDRDLRNPKNADTLELIKEQLRI